jgi:[NiFe] hydrogenase assembly HybE family chaperone
MICPKYLIEGLEQSFRRIQRERMQGAPLLNEWLAVEAVDFRPWQGHCLGVLVTPWFMNLMLLPSEGDEWAGLPVGSKVTHHFPSGCYEFILSHETEIGRYQICSLFSPMFEFADQAAAVATAEAVMQGLMDEENRDATSMREREIERLWRGEPAPDKADLDQSDESPGLAQRLERPISRRQLLRGDFSRES